MNKTDIHIQCPNCETPIDVDQVLYAQLKRDFNKKSQAAIEKVKKSFQVKDKALLKKEQSLQNTIEKEVADKLVAEKDKQYALLKENVEKENAAQLTALHKELEEKSDQVQAFHKLQADMARLKREKQEMQAKLEAEKEKEINERMGEERQRLHRQISDENELKFKEYEKQLSDQKKLIEEMKRKAEQGSMQIQGEVQELAIEAYLKSSFPLDHIEEIKKSVRGADCLQWVNTRSVSKCGAIYYESKREKEFSASWIEKFKADMILKGADIGVLVTQTMPKDLPRMGMKEGIWICSYQEFKGLSIALRESIIKVRQVAISQENKGEKMEMLYAYLTGNEFRMHIEAIVESFTSMKLQIDKEKRSMIKQWKEREKQIEKVMFNTIELYGAFKGIGGNTIQTVKALELEEGEGDELLSEE